MATKKLKVLMLKGLPASGKSHYAKELEAQGWARTNKDDIRKEMFPDYTFKDEKEVVKEEDLQVIFALDAGQNVVVDNTHFNPVHQKRLEKIAADNNADFEVLFIDTPLETCIKRNRKRPNSVPMEVILDMHRKYIAPYRDEKQEYDDKLEEAIIVDVDGTLAHITNRDPYDASRAMEDTLDDAVSNIVNMAYGHGYRVIVLTGRSSEHYKVTQEWLEANGVNYDELYSRDAERDVNDKGEALADTIVKRRLFDTHIKNRFNVKYVIDDRPSVCRMWRALGLKTLQVGDPHAEF